mgnify:CR=1 FL=1
MINYEKYEETIDLILEQWENIAFDKDMKKVVSCSSGFKCKNCQFSYQYNEYQYCNVNRIKWLVAEYVEPVEPEIDWSKVPVDTPVLISVDNRNWFNRYFAGVNEKGQPTVFCYGATQWSNGYKEPCHFKYIKLAEVE